MVKRALLSLSLASLASASQAQDPAPVYQSSQEYKFQLRADGLARQEWTRNLFEVPNQDRWRLQIRPHLDASLHWFRLGVGGEFNWSKDENIEPRPALLRDNYDSRDARLDLAFAGIEASWLRIEGGRFRMPVALTEMLWDRDLRPQGAVVTLRTSGREARLSLTALGARGSHVFDDDDAEMLLLSASADLPSGQRTRLELVGSYLAFRKIAGIEPMIRRQNTRLAGLFTEDYRVVDGILRLRHEGNMPTQLVLDYAKNTAVDQDGSGLWLSLILGSVKQSRSRLEYVYAKVDKDATLAAYTGDDFFWSTGWEGHRGDLGVRASDRAALHGVAQIMRFKDSPRPEERDHWIRRFRLELRFDY
jgi:hypothetical protein